MMTLGSPYQHCGPLKLEKDMEQRELLDGLRPDDNGEDGDEISLINSQLP